MQQDDAVRALAIAFSVAAVCSCGSGNNSPSAPSGLSMLGLPAAGISCQEERDGYQCRADFVTNPNVSGQDVTGLATWSTSDTSIATVNSVGFATLNGTYTITGDKFNSLSVDLTRSAR